MARKPRIKVGQYFSVPLLGGGFAYGYFSFIWDKFVYIADIHDEIGDSPELPADIQDRPLVLRDLTIGGEEFTLEPEEAEEYGGAWQIWKDTAKDPQPAERLWIMGGEVVDILGEQPKRAPTGDESTRLKKLGFNFPPVTHNEIEVALRRLSVDPHEFYPENHKN